MSSGNTDPGHDPGAGAAPDQIQVCPRFHAAIELIGKRWSGAIIWTLADHPARFGDLKRTIPGLSDRLLSRRLRELEGAGLVSRRVEEGRPARVVYSLTDKGQGLTPAVHAVEQWAAEWQ